MAPSDATVRVKSSLPEELIVELLLRLPVKSLARFRCVCKEWKSLTTNPSFISRHFRNGYASNSVIAWNDDNLLKLESMKSGCFRSGVYSFLPLDFKSLGYKKRPDCIVGQCDGIFCFYWEVDDRLALCNPAIRESRDIQLIPYVPTSSESTRDTQWNLFFPTHNDSESDLDSISYSYPYSPNSDTEEWIPHIPNYSDSESDPDSYPYSYPYSSYSGSEILFGFGFDPNTNDYKVVELEEENYKPTNYAKIYSMKSGSWKRRTGDAALQDVVLSSGKQGNSLHSDGVIYWSVFKCAEGQDSDDSELDFDDEPTEAILSLDLRNEVFRLTAFPAKYYAFESISTTQQKKHSLSILHGKLAILCSFIEGSHTSFDVWAMDKDDVQDPWSHVLTVDPLPGFFRALYFWRNSDLVIFEERGRYAMTREWPYLYDHEAKKMEPLEIYGELDFIYRESLVSVKVGNGG